MFFWLLYWWWLWFGGWFRCGWISDMSEWSMDFLMKMEKFVVFHPRSHFTSLIWSDKFELFKLHWHIYQQSTETFLMFFNFFDQSALVLTLSAVHYIMIIVCMKSFLRLHLNLIRWLRSWLLEVHFSIEFYQEFQTTILFSYYFCFVDFELWMNSK